MGWGLRVSADPKASGSLPWTLPAPEVSPASCAVPGHVLGLLRLRPGRRQITPCYSLLRLHLGQVPALPSSAAASLCSGFPAELLKNSGQLLLIF